mmetsp:Transcript_114089/g.333464  ORF Transcript_114089/g.333464 Transcript_114089/m.333464 type:complete len:241 (-) Transcript_114089:1246-1968(-)
MVSVPPGRSTAPQASRRKETVSRCVAGCSPPSASFAAARVAWRSVWCGGSGWFTKSWAQELGSSRRCSASCASPTMRPALPLGSARPRRAIRWKHLAALSKRSSQPTQHAEGSRSACAQSHSPPPVQTSRCTGRAAAFFGFSKSASRPMRLPFTLLSPVCSPCSPSSALASASALAAALALALALAEAFRCFQERPPPGFHFTMASLNAFLVASSTGPLKGRPKDWPRRRHNELWRPSSF